MQRCNQQAAETTLDAVAIRAATEEQPGVACVGIWGIQVRAKTRNISPAPRVVEQSNLSIIRPISPAFCKDAHVSAASLFEYTYLAYLSKPAADRVLYRAIKKHQPRSIVEIGVGTGARSLNLLKLASQYHAASELSYAGIDLFEARENPATGTTLKQAHATLNATGAKVRLTPGEPFMGLARRANSLTNTDLLIISADQQGDSLAQAWFYVPRLLHGASQVFLERETSPGATRFDSVSHAQIEELAGAGTATHRRAA